MGSMSDNEEERRVKSRLDRDVSQYYQRISYKKTVSRKDLPRDNMTIESAHESTGEEESSDKDVEDETYIPSPRAPHHRKGKIIASVGGSGAARDEEESKRGDEHGMRQPIYTRKRYLMWKKSSHKLMSTWRYLAFSRPKILDGGKRSAIRER
jgi:hypothetical protein